MPLDHGLMRTYQTAKALIAETTPQVPVLCVRPHAAQRAAQWFQDHFPGTLIYALKANMSSAIIEALTSAGVDKFDVASLGEIKFASAYPGAELHFMHPVKPRQAIADAYFEFGVRAFALDSISELEKIVEATEGARDLQLFVRLACPNPHAMIPLEGKFGVARAQSAKLLVAVRQRAEKLGVTFHIGSQAMAPQGFSDALEIAGMWIREAGVLVDAIDVGGGFPSRYAGIEPPPLEDYVSAITDGFAHLAVAETCELMCEPGRALVAEAEAVLIRVEARRGNDLYVNDGAFGTLYDAAYSGFTYPARLVRTSAGLSEERQAFRLLGPTCDSVDIMPGPYWLPGSVDEGDFIEVGQVGAYGRVMATGFNGFGRYDEALLRDEPMVSMYGQSRALRAKRQISQ